MRLSEAAISQPHVRRAGKSDEIVTTSTKFAYNLRWTLSYLKKAGFVTNSARGVWSLTETGKQTPAVDSKAVVRQVGATRKSEKRSEDPGVEESSDPDSPAEEQSWTDELLDVIMNLKPDAFERLAQRLLREAGFTEVRVTGRTGDGGIDGSGILRLNDLVSMSAVFQCKRYRDNVGPATIREFRGALIGRADRGIFVTTAGFSPAAIQEASRDGVVPIDLIDGDRLVALLKKFELGVHVEMVESISIEREWFDAI